MPNDVINFGCRLNTYEGEVIRSHLENAGAENVAVFNTCTVTREAERQARQAIRRYRKDHPERRIIVTGCAAQVNPDTFARMPEVDRVLGNQEKLEEEYYYGGEKKRPHPNPLPEGEGISRLPFFSSYSEIEKKDDTSARDHGVLTPLSPGERVRVRAQDQLTSPFPTLIPAHEKVRVNDIMSVKETASHLVAGFEGRARAFMQVQNGCNHRCTFCIIPYGRGNSRSVPMGELASQAKLLVDQGYKEIVLTGVDITSYGEDLPGQPKLGTMVKRFLRAVPELPRLRLSSIDVAEIDGDLMEMIATEARLMPHLHLSLQAGDDMILKRMKRRHTREQALEFVDKVRRLRPEAAFGADIIAGFPTETDAMFENTLKLVEEAGLTWLHVFPYSEREGTPAAAIPVSKQVPKPIRKRRAALLRDAGEKQVKKLLQSRDGMTERVIVEKGGQGRTEQFALVKLAKEYREGELVGMQVAYSDGQLCEAA